MEFIDTPTGQTAAVTDALMWVVALVICLYVSQALAVLFSLGGYGWLTLRAYQRGAGLMTARHVVH